MNPTSSYKYYNENISPSSRQNFDPSYSPMGQDTSSMAGDDVKFLKKKYKRSQNKVFHDFFKTKMCPLYTLNICLKGEGCPFAHSEDELREKPNLAKTKLCETFLEQGSCKYGDQCVFAHGEPELRSTPDLFKTAICNLWNQGKCTSGETCRFAHGVEDLRPAPMHYKSKKPQFTQKFSSPTKAPMMMMQQPQQFQQQLPQQQPQQFQMQQPTAPMYSYQVQYNPVVFENNTFPVYNYPSTFQQVQPQFYNVPFTYGVKNLGARGTPF